MYFFNYFFSQFRRDSLLGVVGGLGLRRKRKILFVFFIKITMQERLVIWCCWWSWLEKKEKNIVFFYKDYNAGETRHLVLLVALA